MCGGRPYPAQAGASTHHRARSCIKSLRFRPCAFPFVCHFVLLLEEYEPFRFSRVMSIAECWNTSRNTESGVPRCHFVPLHREFSAFGHFFYYVFCVVLGMCWVTLRQAQGRSPPGTPKVHKSRNCHYRSPM